MTSPGSEGGPDPSRLPRAEGARINERSRVGGWPIAAAIAVVALLLYAIRYALLPFVFAIAVAFVTDPLIVAGQRRLGARRWIVATLVYLVILAVLAEGGYTFADHVLDELISLIGNLPDIARNLLQQLVGERGVTVFGKSYTAEGLANSLAAAIEGAAGVRLVTKAGELVIGFLLGLVLTLVLIPFLMISGPKLADGAIWLIPPERRPAVIALLPKLIPVLRRYLLGIAVVVAYTAAASWLGFRLLAGLHNAALLALAVAVLEIVPVVGPAAAMALVGLAAIQQSTIHAAILLMAFVVAVRLSIDNLVGPLVLGQATRLHPVIIIAAFVCGAALFGVVGLLLAVPATVCIRLTLEHYYAEPIRRDER